MIDRIVKLVNQGYQFSCGPHQGGLIGYYASLSPPLHGCGNAKVCWEESGHAKTPEQAIEMALAIAAELPIVVPSPSQFRRRFTG